MDFLFNREGTRFTYSFSGILNSENRMLDQTRLNLRVQEVLKRLLFALARDVQVKSRMTEVVQSCSFFYFND